MYIPFLCIFLAFLLNYLSKIPVGFAMGKLGAYDNRHPRAQQAQLKGWGARALAAHQNGFEVFPAFAVSVLVANSSGVDQSTLSVLSVAFLISRIIYIALYLANFSTLRSLIWFVGVAIVGRLLWISL